MLQFIPTTCRTTEKSHLMFYRNLKKNLAGIEKEDNAGTEAQS